MKNPLTIQMVDLQSQYRRLKSEIDSAIGEVMVSGAFIQGPAVRGFEKSLADFTGAKHVVGCGNGTDALMVAFMALEIPKGSEVITPAFSYAAVAETLHLLDLKPVYTEVNPDSFLMDPELIAAAITEKTRAIVPVHLFGQCCDMESILNIAKTHELFVVEDNAQAIGARYQFNNGSVRHSGTMGNIGTTSFFPSKNLGCYGDGGALFTNDDKLAAKIRMIANHGQRVKYNHEVIGLNSRLDSIQAAILNVKLKYLRDFEKARNAVADMYDSLLKDVTEISIPLRVSNSNHVFHQYTLKTENKEIRNELKKHLENSGIPAMIYYPTPLHRQEAYSVNAELKISENLSECVLSLPIHTEMNENQVQFITNTIKDFYKK